MVEIFSGFVSFVVVDSIVDIATICYFSLCITYAYWGKNEYLILIVVVFSI